MSKYHSKKITVDGETFDSKAEYERWCELKAMEKAGLITDLKRQKVFPLIPAQKRKGQRAEMPVTYKADFEYYENGQQVVEDKKGYKTPEYIIKRKLMLYILGIQIKET